MTFAGVKPFPTDARQAEANPRAVIGGNRPPLDEMIVGEFMEGLNSQQGLIAKVEQLIQRGSAAEPCENADMAGRYGDFIKMTGEAVKRIEAERETHNRPLLTAQRALKAKSDYFVDRLKEAASKVRAHLDAFTREEARKAAEAQRLADEQARKAREAAEAERQRQIEEARAAGEDAVGDALSVPEVDVAPVKVDQPVFRGDYGSRVGTTTIWLHEIESVRKLPDAILKHEKVVEAINKVIAAQVRGGTREMKGVRIWSEQRAAVR